MITTMFINLAYYVLAIIFSIFPSSTGFPTSVQTAFTTFAGYTAIINTLVPMNTLGQILGLVISFELIVFAWKGLRFILGYVPVVGGKG